MQSYVRELLTHCRQLDHDNNALRYSLKQLQAEVAYYDTLKVRYAESVQAADQLQRVMGLVVLLMCECEALRERAEAMRNGAPGGVPLAFNISPRFKEIEEQCSEIRVYAEQNTPLHPPSVPYLASGQTIDLPAFLQSSYNSPDQMRQFTFSGKLPQSEFLNEYLQNL